MPRALTLVVALCAALASVGGRAAEPGPARETAAGASPAGGRVYRSGEWVVEETENFFICRAARGGEAWRVGQRFEALRAELVRAWLGAEAPAAWKPKCHIVLHATPSAYVRAVGPGSQSTVGSALVDFEGTSISTRRIDLRGDRADWFTAAVPHELTHVVLADRFAEERIPHWADEGAALLADTLEKRQRHGRDLQAAMQSGAHFRAVELLSMTSYPRPSQMGVFYAQSASLVSFLVAEATPRHFLTFVARANQAGYDAALHEVYDIDGVEELERRWRRSVRSESGAVAELKSPAQQASIENLARLGERALPAAGRSEQLAD